MSQLPTIPCKIIVKTTVRRMVHTNELDIYTSGRCTRTIYRDTFRRPFCFYARLFSTVHTTCSTFGVKFLRVTVRTKDKRSAYAQKCNASNCLVFLSLSLWECSGLGRMHNTFARPCDCHNYAHQDSRASITSFDILCVPRRSVPP